MKARELKQMLTTRFQSGCTKPPLVAYAAETCSWAEKYLLNGGECERNGWSGLLLLMFSSTLGLS